MPMKVATAALALALAACAQLGDDDLYEAAFSDVGGDATLDAVQRIFEQGRCVACHSGAQPQGNLTLARGETAGALLGEDGQGGVPSAHPECDGAPLVTPGVPDESCLWILVDEGLMPPVGELPEAQRGVIRAWIEAGAPVE